MDMEKFVRDGMVAVLYSPGFDAGWSTWNPDYPDMVWDPGMVQLVLESRRDEMMTYAMLKWPDAYLGGLDQLAVTWVAEGGRFRITEFDGNEEVELMTQVNWLQA